MQFHSLACGYSVVLATLVEKAIVFNCLESLLKTN